MAVLTRQQLIDLIDQYIYANGQQRITAVQLREILIDIASSFAMEGGSANGIDAVLAAGSSVTDGRQISNGFGGKVQLAVTQVRSDGGIRGKASTASAAAPVEPLKYVGINVAQDGGTGQVYNSKSKTVIGNISSANLTQTLFDIPFPVTGDDYYVGTIYNLGTDPKGDGKLNLGRGATTIYLDKQYASATSVSDGSIKMHAQEMLEGGYSDISMNDNQISVEVVSGPQSSMHQQSRRSFNWDINGEQVAVIASSGLALVQGKKLGLASGGSNPTSGLATLVAGKVTVPTGAVALNSVISLTVQETGTYTGNIRVSEKNPAGFTISSSVNTDTCKVYWQIIDI